MDTRKVRLLKNSGIYAIGNFASKALIFLLVPLYTYYLSPSEYGQIDVIITSLGILVSIVSLQSVEIVFRYINDAENDQQSGKVITNSLLIALCGMIIFTIGLYSAGAFVKIPYKNEMYFYVLTSIFSNYYMQCVRGLKKSVQYAASGVIITIIQVSLNIILIIGFNKGSYALLISVILANIGAVVYLILRVNIIKFIRFRYIDKSCINGFLRYGLPLIPNAVCLWLSSSVGKYYLTFFSDSKTSVGLVSLATKFPHLLIMVNSIFFMAWQQSAIEEGKSSTQNKYYNEILSLYYKIMTLFLAAALPLTKVLIQYVLGGDYYSSWQYIPLYYIGALFYCLANFCSIGFMVVKKTSWVFISTLCSVIIQIVCCFAMDKTGIWGVSIAYVISQIVYLLLISISVNKYVKFQIPYKDIILFAGICTAILFVYYATSNLVVQIASFIIICLLSIRFLNIKSHMKNILKQKVYKNQDT